MRDACACCHSATLRMALFHASWILSLMIASLSLQPCTGESISASFLPVPTPIDTHTVPFLPHLYIYAVEFSVQSTTLDEWVNTSLLFKAAVADETNTFCSTFSTQCNLQSNNNSALNFTANTMEVLSLEVSGSSLEVVVVVHIPSTTSLLPQETLQNILLGASSSIYQTTGKNITEITPYMPPLSTLLHPTPSPLTLNNGGDGGDGGGGILSFLPDTLTSLSLPVLVGAAIIGTALLLIVIIFLISSVVVLRERCNKSNVRKLNLKQVKPSRSSNLAW